MRRTKDVLTTGDVAKICSVAPRTVSKWFDSGKLRGYRIPGSKDRRIPLQQLLRFMKAHGIPLDGLETGVTRIVIAEHDKDMAELLSEALSRDAGFDVHTARTTFEAGAVAENVRPHVMLLDVDLPGLASRETVRSIQNLPMLRDCKLVVVTGPMQSGEEEALRQQGFDCTLSKPLDVTKVVRVIEDLLAPQPISPV